MKIKSFLFLLLLSFMLYLPGCIKDCTFEIAECSDSPPADEACQAYFERWFFSKDLDACELIGYSGCSEYGFATEEECSTCKCN